MKNWFKRIPKDKLQKIVFLGMLGVLFVVFFVSLQLVNEETSGPSNPGEIQNPQDDNNTPTPDTTVAEKFIAPINSEAYSVVRSYFDETLEDSELEKAVMTYESGKYICSIGMSFALSDNSSFECIAAMSGEVTSVNEDSLYGFVVTITHEDGFTTEYSSLSEVTVKVGDKVKQGSKIGTSGEALVDSQAGNHVYFVVRHNKSTLNPTSVFGKTVDELQ